jgi:hypothetical protein
MPRWPEPKPAMPDGITGIRFGTPIMGMRIAGTSGGKRMDCGTAGGHGA